MQNMNMSKLQSDRLKYFPNVNSLLKISLGLVLFTIITTLVYAETISVDVENTSFNVDYTATGMTLNSIDADLEFTSLILSVDVPGPAGVLDITFERSFFDSTFEGFDEEYFVLVDQDEGNFSETETTSQSRTLSINLPSGSEEIEIIGSSFGESELISIVDPNEAADKAAADKAAADKAAADKAAADKAAADKAAADKAAADKAAADKAAADKAAADKAAADISPTTQCGPGTVLEDGACVLDERCGPGTVLEDGVCVLDSTPKSSETTQGMSKQMVIAVIAAFIISGTIGVILAIISKASKSND